MKYLVVGALSVLLSGCAYNNVEITAQGSVTCNASVDKPVSIDALGNALRGANAPVAVGAQPNSSGTMTTK